MYKDIATGNEDSFWVFMNYNSDFRGDYYTREQINIGIHSTPRYPTNDTPHISVNLVSFNSIEVRFLPNPKTLLLELAPIAHYPFSPADATNGVSDTGVQMIIGGRLYKGIALFKGNYVPTHTLFDIYINDQVGILKMKINSSGYNKDWELERWNVIK